MPENTPAQTMRCAAARLRKEAGAARAELEKNGCITDGHGPDECYTGSVDDSVGGPIGLYASYFPPGFADLLADAWDAQAGEMDDYPAVFVTGGVGIPSFQQEPDRVWTAAYAAAQRYLDVAGIDGTGATDG